MAQSFANNAQTILNGAITSGATTLTPNSASGFPTSGSYTIMVYLLANGLVTNAELMLVTAGQGTTTWTVSRAQEGTAAVAHANGESIVQILTLAGLQSLGNGFWPYLAPSGITGATQPTRYAGGTVSGPPTTGGPFALGDFIIDRTGRVWICVGAGSPGSWSSAGGGSPLVCRIFANASVAVPPSTTFSWGGASITFDPSSMLTSSGANPFVTLPVTGYWRIYYQMWNTTGTTGIIYGIAATNFPGQAQGITGNVAMISFSDTAFLPAGTTVQPQVINGNATNNLPAFNTGTSVTYMTFEFVGP